MPTGRSFAIAGESRLASRVAEMLLEFGANVTVVADDQDEDHLELLPEDVTVVPARGTWRQRLRDARLADHECLLVLSEDDLLNLQIVAAAHDAAESRRGGSAGTAGPRRRTDPKRPD